MAKIAHRWCDNCQDMVRGDWSGANHVLHLLLSVVTVGLWLPVWLFLSLGGGYRCVHCGQAVRAHGPPTALQRGGAKAVNVIGFTVVGSIIAVAAYVIIAANIDAAG